METLKLAFLADRTEPFYHGGYERHLWTLARQLAVDHDVSVLSSTPPALEEVDGVRLVRIAPQLTYIRKEGGHSLGQALEFAAAAAVLTPNLAAWDFVDILGIPYVHLPLLQLRATHERWRWGVTVWEAWWDYAYLQPPLASISVLAFRFLLRLTVRGDHPVVVGSRLTRDALVTRFGVHPRRIYVNSPGVDRALIASIESGGTSFDVIFVGRLEGHKRVADLIEACARLHDEGLSLHVGIVGNGAERASLEALARYRGVGSSVEFLGEVGERAKFGLLKAARLFVLPSEREGFSIATLEAMACALPVLVAQPSTGELFGVGELLPANRPEFTYPARNPAALAAKMRALLSDDAALRRLGAELERRSEAYDLRGLAARYLASVRGGS
jgi:glycosyltransferase involved in cell wall biosynthesis